RITTPMDYTSSVYVVAVEGRLQKFEEHTVGFIETAVNVTKNYTGPKIEYLIGAGLMKVNSGETPLDTIDFTVFGAEVSAFAGPTCLGYGAKLVLRWRSHVRLRRQPRSGRLVRHRDRGRLADDQGARHWFPAGQKALLLLAVIVSTTMAATLVDDESSDARDGKAAVTSSELGMGERRIRRYLSDESQQKYRLQVLRLCLKYEIMCEEVEGGPPIGYMPASHDHPRTQQASPRGNCSTLEGSYQRRESAGWGCCRVKRGTARQKKHKRKQPEAEPRLTSNQPGAQLCSVSCISFNYFLESTVAMKLQLALSVFCCACLWAASQASAMNSNYTVTEEVWFEVRVKDMDGPGEDFTGKFTVAVFGEAAPMTTMNFVSLARGYKFRGENLHYKNTPVHRVVPDFVVQMGDITTGEAPAAPASTPFILSHRSPGWIAMANHGPDTNGSQFYILLTKARWLDNKHVVFGKVIKGFDVVKTVGEVPSDPDTAVPQAHHDEDCGVVGIKERYELKPSELDSTDDVKRTEL
uniref:PPIase cyclophilin-type domain-containing protein n=1 Tax=Macrostomum lignano TaxID=282301 RepID=A0A1I8FHN5_9PLAT